MEPQRLLHVLSRVLTGCAFLIAAGCGGTLRMYSGPELPRERLAVLTIPREIKCSAIDGRKVRTENVRRVELLPGTHTVRIQYFGKKLRTQFTNLSFNMEPGHDYEIRYRMYRIAGNRIYSPEYLKAVLSSPKEKRRELLPETVFGANRWCPFVFDPGSRRRVTLRNSEKDGEVTAILNILGRQDRAVAGIKAMQAKAIKNRKGK